MRRQPWKGSNGNLWSQPYVPLRRDEDYIYIYWHFKIIKLYPFRKYSDTLLGNSEEGEGKGQKPKFLKKSKKSNRNFQRAGRLKSKAFC